MLLAWGGFGIVDVDDYEGSIEDIHEKYSKYKYVCYSTASSTKAHPKFRLVFPLTESVPADKIKHFWFALNKEIGDIADAQTKDLSRMYYVPSRYKDAYNFIFTHDGSSWIQTSSWNNTDTSYQMNRFSISLPESIRNGLVEHRKSQLNNTNFSWTGYKDCPFVNKKQVEEYKGITGAGWYLQMYKIMVSTAGNAMQRGYPISATRSCMDLFRLGQ